MSLDKYIGIRWLDRGIWDAFVRSVATEVAALRTDVDANKVVAQAVAARGLQVIEDYLSPLIEDAGDKRDAIAALLVSAGVDIEALIAGADGDMADALTALAIAVAQVEARRDAWLAGILDASAVAETASRLWLTPSERTAIAEAPTTAAMTSAISTAVSVKLVADFSGLTALGTPAGTELLAVRDGATSKQIAIADLLGLVGGGPPPGAIIYTAMSTAPGGFLKANGAEISRTTYADLFAAIGTTFGVGNGSTTFALPDLRGEFLRAYDDGRGVDSGRAFGSSQADGLKRHDHHGGFGPATGMTARYGFDTGLPSMTLTGDFYSAYAGQTQAPKTSPTGGTETRPRNIALLACIKY